jgi:hypothetical protein
MHVIVARARILTHAHTHTHTSTHTHTHTRTHTTIHAHSHAPVHVMHVFIDTHAYPCETPDIDKGPQGAHIR